MKVLDASSLVRFFTNDIPSRAQEVKKLLESQEKLCIPDVVFPELEYVLSGSTYQSSRENIAEAFQFLISRKQTVVSQELKTAIKLYVQTTLDIADCLILSSALGGELVSYDTQLLKEYKKASLNQ